MGTSRVGALACTRALVDLLVQGNDAGVFGGGGAFLEEASVVAEGTTFSGNDAELGSAANVRSGATFDGYQLEVFGNTGPLTGGSALRLTAQALLAFSRPAPRPGRTRSCPPPSGA